MYSASLASRMEKIWWMARGMTPAEVVRSVPSLLFLGPPCSSNDLASFQRRAVVWPRLRLAEVGLLHAFTAICLGHAEGHQSKRHLWHMLP